MKKKILAAALGNCVHVAGILHFLALAADLGWDTVFLGPAIPVPEIINAINREQPDVCAVGYRLTPQNGVCLVRSLQEGTACLSARPRFVFGGTRPVAEAVRPLNFFDVVFDGSEDLDDCLACLRTDVRSSNGCSDSWPQSLIERLESKRPYPLLRHHFGLPSYPDTLRGIEEIADSRCLDVLSLGIDQNTQQFFFHPEQRCQEMEGAGGVPVHSEEEFSALRLAARRGNHPLMRCYSGTADVLNFSAVLEKSIVNAWCAVPLCWYNTLDGRGTRTQYEAMCDAQTLLRVCSARGIPAEVNEPHHWGLRDAPDVISVAMSYISAYNAKKCGIRDYISQYMFNIPSGIRFAMDLAKVWAQIDLTESLCDDRFHTLRQVRAGLPFLNADPDVARGQLAASTMLAMNVRPDIIHVVGYSEAERAATPDVVIGSCRLVRGVIRSTLEGNADAAFDPAVQARRSELLREAGTLLNYIRTAYASVSPDPLADPLVLCDCIERGVLDAPHIKGSRMQTRIVDGKCLVYHPQTSTYPNEEMRLSALTLPQYAFTH